MKEGWRVYSMTGKYHYFRQLAHDVSLMQTICCTTPLYLASVVALEQLNMGFDFPEKTLCCKVCWKMRLAELHIKETKK